MKAQVVSAVNTTLGRLLSRLKFPNMKDERRKADATRARDTMVGKDSKLKALRLQTIDIDQATREITTFCHNIGMAAGHEHPWGKIGVTLRVSCLCLCHFVLFLACDMLLV